MCHSIMERKYTYIAHSSINIKLNFILSAKQVMWWDWIKRLYRCQIIMHSLHPYLYDILVILGHPNEKIDEVVNCTWWSVNMNGRLLCSTFSADTKWHITLFFTYLRKWTLKQTEPQKLANKVKIVQNYIRRQQPIPPNNVGTFPCPPCTRHAQIWQN